MEPDKDKGKRRKAARAEFEVDYSSRHSGRSLRKLLQQRLANIGDSNIDAASHAEEPSPDRVGPTPREDRAG
ncbi:MAG TPA: hypothetical protein VN649_01255 [Ramlibacter sp.]|nr:hypothetical protein [Ramlibacter sp.]